MLSTYEITVNGVHAARISVRHQMELCDIVHTIRRVYDRPVDYCEGRAIYADVDEGGVEIRATLVRMR